MTIEQGNSKPKYNEKISNTAWSTAYRRTFTDIPYAEAVFQEIVRLGNPSEIPLFPNTRTNPEIAPQLEARYKLVNKLLRDNPTTQVVEIAAGISTRGLEITDDPHITYMEVDLPEIAFYKTRIVDAISRRTGAKPKNNLQIVVGNVLDLDSLQAAVRHLLNPNQPLAIINEGLLRYLSFDEKARTARNIHVLLEQFGGVWITPDIIFPYSLTVENGIDYDQTDAMKALTEVDIDSNRFENIDEATVFFENLGFTVERHGFMEAIDELSSPQRLGKSREEVEVIIKDSFAFVMKV